jgi:hypothetical protein
MGREDAMKITLSCSASSVERDSRYRFSETSRRHGPRQRPRRTRSVAPSPRLRREASICEPPHGSRTVSKSLLLFILLMSVLASLLYPIHAPRMGVREGRSSTWAGYAVVTSILSPQEGVVSGVNGSWTVPAVDCSVTPTAYASFWIGIDGYSSNTVEQIGTESDCFSGSGIYYAWYEMYPEYAVDLNMKISPGDAVSAEVQYLGGGSFNLTVTDTKTGASSSTTQKSTSAARSSAEWIAEAPSSGGVRLPLADFGTVTFQGAQATLNGHAGTISDSAWQYDRIDLVSSSGSSKPIASALSTDGTSFSVEWYFTTTATLTTTPTTWTTSSTSTTSTTGTSTMTSQSTTTSTTTSSTTTTPVTTQTTTQGQTTTTVTTQQLTTSTTQIASATTTQVGQGSGIGFAFAAIGIGVGVASAGVGLAVAATGQPQSEVFTYGGYYYCRKHRVPVWYVQGGLWCPVEQRYLRP